MLYSSVSEESEEGRCEGGDGGVSGRSGRGKNRLRTRQLILQSVATELRSDGIEGRTSEAS